MKKNSVTVLFVLILAFPFSANAQFIKTAVDSPKVFMDFKPAAKQENYNSSRDYWHKRAEAKAWGAVLFVVLLFAALILSKKKGKK